MNTEKQRFDLTIFSMVDLREKNLQVPGFSIESP